MNNAKTILFVNPWQGIIGPNVVMRQMAAYALACGHDVHMASKGSDEFLRDLEEKGVTCHVVPELEITPRTVNPLRLLGHCWRSWWLSRRIGRLAREKGADIICINNENMLLTPRCLRRNNWRKS